MSNMLLISTRQFRHINQLNHKFIYAFIASAIAALIFYHFHSEKMDSDAIERRSIETAVESARYFSQSVSSIVENADSKLKSIRRTFEANFLVSDVELFLKDVPIDQNIKSHVTIIDKNGTPLFNSKFPVKEGVNVLDRYYFQQAKIRNSDDKLFISPPHRGRNSGNFIIRLVRPYYDQFDEFAGVIFIAINPDAFVQFFELMTWSDTGVATLVGYDQIIRARSSQRETALGQKISGSTLWDSFRESPEGVYRQESVVDNITRYYAYRAIPEIQVIAAIGFSISHIEMEINKEANSRYLFSGLFFLILVFMCWFLIREQKNSTILRESSERVFEAQEGLSTERRRLASIIESTSIGTWEWNVPADELRFNQRWADITGHRMEGLRGGSAAMLTADFQPDDQAAARERLEAHFRGATPFYEIAARVRHSDGHFVHVFDRGKVISWGQDGAPAMMYGARSDISDLIMARADAECHRARFRAIFEQAPDAIVTIDRQGGITALNMAAQIMFGVGEAAVVGQSFEQFLDDPSKAAMFQPAADRSADLMLPVYTAERTLCVTAEGTRFPAALSISEVRGGREAFWIVCLRDMSVLEAQQASIRAEADRFDHMLEISGNRFWELDADGVCTMARGRWGNGEALDTCALVGRPFVDLLEERQREPGLTRLMAALRGREPFDSIFLETKSPEGEHGFAAMSGTPIHTAEGAFAGWRMVTTELTEPVRVAELRSALETKSRLAATVSHDLRQPIQALMLFLGLAKDAFERRQIAEAIHQADEVCASLSRKVDTFLDLARLDADMIRPQLKTVDIGRVLDRVADEFAMIGAARGTALRRVIHAAEVVTDPVLLERILGNVIHNATKFAAGSRILVGLRERADAVLIEIHDDGPGIAAENLDDVFRAWDRRHRLPATGEDGTGIGLSVSRQIADALGIGFELSSKAGRGTRVTLVIPREADHGGTPDAAAQTSAHRIVVVDDDDAVRRALVASLSSPARTVLAYPNGEAALAARADWAGADMLFADFNLGTGMDGVALITAVRTDPALKIARLFILSGEPADDIENQIGTGGDVHVTILRKPIRLDEIRSIIGD